MPVKKSAFKALRQSEKRAARNARVKMDLKTDMKKTRQLLVSKADEGQVVEAVKKVIKQTDKALQKGLIKANKAARMKSRLLRDVEPSVKQTLFTKNVSA